MKTEQPNASAPTAATPSWGRQGGVKAPSSAGRQSPSAAARVQLKGMDYADGAGELSPMVQLKPTSVPGLSQAELQVALGWYKSHRSQYPVEVAQRIQEKVGTDPDGIIGPITVRGIARWQGAHGLGVDGIAGPITVNAMFGQDIRAIVGNAQPTTSEAETTGGPTAGEDAGLSRPHGYTQIVKVFGKPGTNQVTTTMRCGPGGKMQKVTCHKKLAGILAGVFEDIWNAGLSDHIHSWDGCYVYRTKRGGSTFSTHAWGIAVDVNASGNPMVSNKAKMKVTDSQKALAPFFEARGFYWGKNFGDPMHFQYCTGY